MDSDLAYQRKVFKTNYAVELVFWMAGDFVVVVTLNTSMNIYWLELYTFDKEIAIDRV